MYDLIDSEFECMTITELVHDRDTLLNLIDGTSTRVMAVEYNRILHHIDSLIQHRLDTDQ